MRHLKGPLGKLKTSGRQKFSLKLDTDEEEITEVMMMFEMIYKIKRNHIKNGCFESTVSHAKYTKAIYKFYEFGMKPCLSLLWLRSKHSSSLKEIMTKFEHTLVSEPDNVWTKFEGWPRLSFLSFSSKRQIQLYFYCFQKTET